MKLGTCVPQGQERPRVAALCVFDGVEYLIDTTAAYASALRHVDRDPLADEIAAARVPREMIALLEGGEATLRAVKRGVDFVEQALQAGEKPQTLVDQCLLQRRSAVRLLAPIPRPPKIVGVGANYQDHIQEGRQSGAIGNLPSYPPAFLKMPSAVVGPDEPIVYPRFGSELDYEVEFSIVIGKRCKDVRAEQWLDVVAGYTIVNDLSLRDVILQEKDTGIVFVGKNFATSCPMGPFIVTKDEVPTPDNLAIRLKVNGELRQSDRTSSMIHSCASIVAYWSRLGLEPGDVITTGTPGGGAGFGRKHPERLLKVGDVVEAEVEGIGVLRNHVVSDAPREPDLKRAASVTVAPV